MISAPLFKQFSPHLVTLSQAHFMLQIWPYNQLLILIYNC